VIRFNPISNIPNPVKRCRDCTSINDKTKRILRVDDAPKMKAEHFRKREPHWFIAGQRMRWLFALTLILALACVVDWFVSRRNHASAALQPISSGSPAASASADPARISKNVPSPEAPEERSERVFYLYSVIPGGIRSIQELKTAIASDPIVSAHYTTFHMENARIIRLDRERSMHVSYRMGNEVFWTKRELTVKKGETLVTDGVQTARMRCGNLISETVVAQVYPNEPPVEELNTLEKSPFTPGELESDDRFPDLESPPEANVPSPGGSSPVGGTDLIGHGTGPIIFLPPASGPIPYPTAPARPPIVNTPEPGTAIQLLVSVLAMLFLLKRWPKGPLEGLSGKR
jgi:hypothetical protein